MKCCHFLSLVGLSSLALQISAQSTSQSESSTNSSAATSTAADYATSGITYIDGSTTITFGTTSDYATISDLSSAMATANGTTTASSGNSTVTSTSSATATTLHGTAQMTTSLNGTATRNLTASSTSSAATATNTVPCNGYAEFCQRKFSNITHVAAHNSPFIRSGNLAANQQLDVTTQLNDGIRMLQFQAHLLNGTMYLCHTSCDLLNVGTLEAYLTTVTAWLKTHTTDVITILIGNYDVVNPNNFTAPVVNSGLIDYVYTPPTMPMPLESWPTLGAMILKQQRAVVMLDYEANQTAIPWLLDEFSQMWETPFSPTDRAFPCTVQRPPQQAPNISAHRMYMANHNLNLDVDLAGISLLVPFFSLLNETNAVTGYGSAGLTTTNCTARWNRPPNFLLVDYYNIGSYNGSVFQVAADANNVTYNKASCCGTSGTSAAGKAGIDGRLLTLTLLAIVVLAAL
ncbi:PLC-like phosphodiesterase [Exophiala viscosa]|uniref:PLC-like phosphodiesterase n=1 Tax=Exophiala viscosa TaxID=2486360 RepID=A0AAN6IEI3_9EURO|nr:PLC-like phosphodiesterase [Exophiala viscosa]